MEREKLLSSIYSLSQVRFRGGINKYGESKIGCYFKIFTALSLSGYTVIQSSLKIPSY